MMANKGSANPTVITNKLLLGVRTDDLAIYNPARKGFE